MGNCFCLGTKTSNKQIIRCPPASPGEKKNKRPPRSEGDILQSAKVRSFSFNELRSSTRNFRPDSVLSARGASAPSSKAGSTTGPAPESSSPSRSSTNKGSRATGNMAGRSELPGPIVAPQSCEARRLLP
ncbi:unnamed protein product [Urochloa humidicola]